MKRLNYIYKRKDNFILFLTLKKIINYNLKKDNFKFKILINIIFGLKSLKNVKYLYKLL